MTTIVVVLGLRPDSEELPAELQGRVDLGIDVFRRTDASKLVFAGGYTNEAVDLAESEMMARYALSRDVPPEAILEEDRSADTLENAYYSRLIQRRLDSKTVYVVTSCYHVERCEFVFGRLFPEAVRLRFECYEADRPEDERYEAEALCSARDFLEGVRKGDVDEVARRLGSNE